MLAWLFSVLVRSWVGTNGGEVFIAADQQGRVPFLGAQPGEEFLTRAETIRLAPGVAHVPGVPNPTLPFRIAKREIIFAHRRASKSAAKCCVKSSRGKHGEVVC